MYGVVNRDTEAFALDTIIDYFRKHQAKPISGFRRRV
jgi:hypothetical protein